MKNEWNYHIYINFEWFFSFWVMVRAFIYFLKFLSQNIFIHIFTSLIHTLATNIHIQTSIELTIQHSASTHKILKNTDISYCWFFSVLTNTRSINSNHVQPLRTCTSVTSWNVFTFLSYTITDKVTSTTLIYVWRYKTKIFNMRVECQTKTCGMGKAIYYYNKDRCVSFIIGQC